MRNLSLNISPFRIKTSLSVFSRAWRARSSLRHVMRVRSSALHARGAVSSWTARLHHFLMPLRPPAIGGAQGRDQSWVRALNISISAINSIAGWTTRETASNY